MAEQKIITGGINFEADQINIGGDAVARDKIVNNITAIYQRALTATEETEQAKSIEAQQLKQGVIGFLQRLRNRASDATDATKGGPYKGLLEYRLSDAEIFFGRTQAIVDLIEHLQRGPLTVLHAESGAGKTSLLQAGVSPYLLQRGHLPVYLRPYQTSPSLAIKRAFVANLNDTPNLGQAPLRDFLTRVSGALGSPTTLFIFLDQFEEFFTQLEEAKRADFVNELADCLDDDSLNVRWVLALRTEFFGNLANFRPRLRNPFENDYRLNRLTRVEAHEAITRPAAQNGISFADGLIDQMLDALGKEEIAPPQVQLVCSALYEALPANTKVITRQLYQDDLRGAEGILREHLGRVLHRDLPADQRPIAQHALEALITSDVHRVLRTRAELAAELALRDTKPATLDQVLNQLVDSRLLRAEEIDGQLSYELAHDYLLSEIQIDPAVQARKAAQELLEQETRAYQRYGTLLSDDKLAILAPRRSELVLDDAAQALLQKSERALKRRQRLVFGGIGLVVALIIIGLISIASAIGAGQQQQAAIQTQHIAETEAANANTQKANALSSAATAQALQATADAGASIAATREAIANDTLRRAFEQTGIVPVGKSPSDFAFDGTRLWVANEGDLTIQPINPKNGQAGSPISVQAGAESSSISDHPLALAFAAGRLWVANENDSTVKSIDPATGQIGISIAVNSRPIKLFFDGTRLWVANFSTVQSIVPTTGQASTPIIVGTGVSALSFDGTHLWIGNLNDNTVQSIDPTTGQAGIPIKVDVGPIALAFDGKHLWSAHWSDNKIQSIDISTGQAGTPISVGEVPVALAFDGARLWIANRHSNTIQAIDPTTSVSGPLITSQEPVALINVENRLWIANQADNTVQAVDRNAGDIGSPISVGTYPNALAFDGTHIWVANRDGNTVQSINVTTSQVSPPIQVGRYPIALAFDGRQIWVANGLAHTIQSIDPQTNQVSQSITISGFLSNLVFDTLHAQLWAAIGNDAVQSIDPRTGQVSTPIKVGAYPSALVFDDTLLWVANYDDGTVQSIDSVTGQVGTPIAVGIHPAALAFDGTRLWVANIETNKIRFVTTKTGIVGEPITVTTWPIAFAFDGTRLWIANNRSSTIQSIDPVTNQLSAPIAVSNEPTALAFDGARLWIANSGNNTVQYIIVHK